MMNTQQTLFETETQQFSGSTGKTYRAIRHDVTRAKQKQNADEVHHPDEKINQIRKVLSGIDLSILELFSGNGNCTKIYSDYGEVLAFEKKGTVYNSLVENVKDCMLVQCNKADSFLEFHSRHFNIRFKSFFIFKLKI